jgi:hypothetical protein
MMSFALAEDTFGEGALRVSVAVTPNPATIWAVTSSTIRFDPIEIRQVIDLPCNIK